MYLSKDTTLNFISPELHTHDFEKKSEKPISEESENPVRVLGGLVRCWDMSLKQKLHIFPGRMAIEHHGPNWREATVVDVGAGTGLLSVMCGKFARQVPGVSVVEAQVGPWRFQKVAKTSPFPSSSWLSWSSNIHHRLFTIHHPSSIIHHPLVVHHPSSIAHHHGYLPGDCHWSLKIESFSAKSCGEERFQCRGQHWSRQMRGVCFKSQPPRSLKERGDFLFVCFICNNLP